MENALIYAFKESNWFSCTKIVGNLLKCYEEIFDKETLLRIDYNFEEEFYDLNNTVNEILEKKPKRIIFVDHRPNPRVLVRTIFDKAPDTYKPEIIFHVYGDFTIYWKDWAIILINRKVKFFCASDAQVELVKKFVENKNAVYKVPFPVDYNEFNLEKKTKKNIRKDLKIDDDSIVLTYTGRFSLHKNITQLVEVYFEALKTNSIKSNTHLLLAGNFDNVGFMFGNIYHHEGEVFREFDRMYQKYPDKLKKNIHFLGNINNDELKDYYLESDYFISLSTYHDEDYGMSVAEAGACGCKMILTDWAGYRSFKLNKYVDLVPTKVSKLGPSFDKGAADSLLKKVSINKQRELISNSFKEKSVESVTKSMIEFINIEEEVFKGFTELFLKLARRSQNGNKVFYDEMNRQMNAEYMEVYESYATRN